MVRSRNETQSPSSLWLLNPMMPHLPAVIHAHWRTEKLHATPHRYRYRYIYREEGGLQSSWRSFCMLIVCLICPSLCLSVFVCCVLLVFWCSGVPMMVLVSFCAPPSIRLVSFPLSLCRCIRQINRYRYICPVECRLSTQL